MKNSCILKVSVIPILWNNSPMYTQGNQCSTAGKWHHSDQYKINTKTSVLSTTCKLSCAYATKIQDGYTESPFDQSKTLAWVNMIYFNVLISTEDNKIYGISMNLQLITYASVQCYQVFLYSPFFSDDLFIMFFYLSFLSFSCFQCSVHGLLANSKVCERPYWRL